MSGKIWLSSDFHFCHDREFIYRPRGFETVWDMNSAIVERWNQLVDINDECYVLGDIMLNNNEIGMNLLQSLKGHIHIIAGNHDTDTRRALYIQAWNVEDIKWADLFNYKGYHFYLSHFPAMTGNLENESLKKMTCNLHGHTHSKQPFYNDLPYCYNVAVDAHDCAPVLLDDIIADMKAKVQECIEKL